MQLYPQTQRFVLEIGWIEIGYDDFSESFVRALDIGGLVWEGKANYASLDEALADLEQGIVQWLQETRGQDS